ncbi:MAG: hypothetical protein BGO55_00595 [Sphingobacteriales bacterium 50-39]|nr:hypothetical protein [Sphingobacteriales bacterium]OJW53613.1 MAG: hypothetical protein BGO55_00595 [Sphingobacteriales bacterium 50-39]
MALSITPKFTREQLREIIKTRMDKIEMAAISRLQFVGEKFVTNARNNGAYKDRTGNLRSSVGYVIMKDGVQIAANWKVFPAVDQKAKNAGIGVEKGQEAIDEIAKELTAKYPKGLILIGVAGMDYAAAVEAGNYRAGYEGGTYVVDGPGRDVITASSIQAAADLKKGFEELQSKIAQMK